MEVVLFSTMSPLWFDLTFLSRLRLVVEAGLMCDFSGGGVNVKILRLARIFAV